MKIHKLACLTLALLISSITACKRKQDGGGEPGTRQAVNQTITIKGSDTMVTLGQRWAEVYMEKDKDAVVQVTGGGSGTGISALINGTTDICQASRAMKDKEVQTFEQKHGSKPVELEVAKDGLAVYVNASNPVNELTFKQLEGIFRGSITNWKDVGGPDKPIVVYSRENSSGTYVFFKEAVLEGTDFAATAQTMPGTAAVVNAVSKEAASIGYGGAAYATSIKVLKVKKSDADAAIAPSDATVKDGSYPLSRPLYFYLAKSPEGGIKAFIDWVLSPEGQKLVTEVGYYPIN